MGGRVDKVYIIGKLHSHTHTFNGLHTRTVKLRFYTQLYAHILVICGTGLALPFINPSHTVSRRLAQYTLKFQGSDTRVCVRVQRLRNSSRSHTPVRFLSHSDRRSVGRLCLSPSELAPHYYYNSYLKTNGLHLQSLRAHTKYIYTEARKTHIF